LKTVRQDLDALTPLGHLMVYTYWLYRLGATPLVWTSKEELRRGVQILMQEVLYAEVRRVRATEQALRRFMQERM
jgi:hypothetical protein